MNDMLEMATRLPALRTVAYVRRQQRERVTPILQRALWDHCDAVEAWRAHPTKANEIWETERSRWAWLAPALIASPSVARRDAEADWRIH